MPFESLNGSMGRTVPTRYVEFPLRAASRSSALPGLTYLDTSAMWTPTSVRPPGMARTEIASSKSLASSGSMVIVIMPRASNLPEMSRAPTDPGTPSASRSTASGKVSEWLYFASIARYSAIGVWLSPRFSTISPVGFMCFCAHSLSLATTLSFSFGTGVTADFEGSATITS